MEPGRFGNTVATASFGEPAAELVIKNSLIVEQGAPAWPIFSIAPSAYSYPFAYSDAEALGLGALMAPKHPDPDAGVENWARAFICSTPTGTLSLLKDINDGVLRRISYRTRDEAGTQTPAQSLS